jgi:hypothetical protein
MPLATAVRELMGTALLQADWGFAADSGPPAAGPAAPARLLN